MTLRRRFSAAALVAAGALFASADIGSVAPARATIGSAIAVDGTGFGAAKAPKVALVNPAGGRAPKLKLVLPFSDAHLDLVVTSVVRDEPGPYDLVVTPDGGAPFTKPGAVELAYAQIDAFTPQASPGDEVAVSGRFFGSKKGKLIIGTKKSKITSWTDTQIVAKLSKKTHTGVVPVWVATKFGNTITTRIGMTVVP